MKKMIGLSLALIALIIISFQAGYDLKTNEEPIKYQLYEFFDWDTPTEQTIFAPKDRISEDQITVGKDFVLIKMDDPMWSSYENTNSMLPTLSNGHNGIYQKPKGEWDLQIGDIVAYQLGDEIVVHRIVGINKNADGETVFTLKGDNNEVIDPEIVKYDQIKRVLVGMLY